MRKKSFVPSIALIALAALVVLYKTKHIWLKLLKRRKKTA